MATVGVSLPSSQWLPSADSVGANSADRQVKQSSNGAGLSPRWIEILFDASTDEHIFISFMVPLDYVGTPTLRVFYKAFSATSGTVAWQVRVSSVTPDDAADADALAFDTSNDASEAIPGTAGFPGMLDITLANADSMAAGDWVVLMLNRDISVDTVAGDIEFVGSIFTYANA